MEAFRSFRGTGERTMFQSCGHQDAFAYFVIDFVYILSFRPVFSVLHRYREDVLVII